MKIVIVAGARPNFMKIAPLAREFNKTNVTTCIVHSGQHYDQKMSQTFFDELNIPHPDVNLEVGSGSHVWQIAEVMKRIEPVLTETQPSAVIVVGDVNSTVAATIAAVKLDIPVAHVEAGLRSFDRRMPEETNRVLTDSISTWLFTSEPSGTENLRREGVPEERIHFVGNVMIDTLLTHRERAAALREYERFELKQRHYAVLTLHRPSNVDDPAHLDSILDAVGQISERLPILFVVHPRTRKRIQEFGFQQQLERPALHLCEPLGYYSMLGMMDAARMVLTDSGGVQEETTVLGVPCITLRENTERPVTVDTGNNSLVGWNGNAILEAAERILNGQAASGRVPEKWDGHAAARIVAILARDLAKS